VKRKAMNGKEQYCTFSTLVLLISMRYLPVLRGKKQLHRKLCLYETRKSGPYFDISASPLFCKLGNDFLYSHMYKLVFKLEIRIFSERAIISLYDKEPSIIMWLLHSQFVVTP
jgi:hypothetical protein